VVDMCHIIAPVISSNSTVSNQVEVGSPIFIIVDTGAADSILNNLADDLGPLQWPYTYEIAGGLSLSPQCLGSIKLKIDTEHASSPLLLDVSGSRMEHDGPILLSVNHPAVTDVHLKCHNPRCQIHGTVVPFIQHRGVWSFGATTASSPPV